MRSNFYIQVVLLCLVLSFNGEQLGRALGKLQQSEGLHFNLIHVSLWGVKLVIKENSVIFYKYFIFYYRAGRRVFSRRWSSLKGDSVHPIR